MYSKYDLKVSIAMRCDTARSTGPVVLKSPCTRDANPPVRSTTWPLNSSNTSGHGLSRPGRKSSRVTLISCLPACLTNRCRRLSAFSFTCRRKSASESYPDRIGRQTQWHVLIECDPQCGQQSVVFVARDQHVGRKPSRFDPTSKRDPQLADIVDFLAPFQRLNLGRDGKSCVGHCDRASGSRG